jgi:signal peptidase
MGRLLRVAAFLAFAGWFLVFRPQSLGGPAGWILVAGNSMEPTIRPGSLVVVMSRAEYGVGDVVAYRIPDGNPGAGDNVIHRIVGGAADAGFIVRGDNTGAPDIWRPGPWEIVGAAWLIVPDGALPLLFLRSPIVIASLAAGFATYLVLGLIGPPRPRGVRPSEQGMGSVEVPERPWVA